MGVTGFILAERLVGLGRRGDCVMLTDLPEVCDLLRENLRMQQTLRLTDVRVAPLPWGNRNFADDIMAQLASDGRRITHVICSDLVRARHMCSSRDCDS